MNALEPLETFQDLESDEAMSIIAFTGLGQVYLRRSLPGGGASSSTPNISEEDEELYEVDCTAVGTLPVRDKFEQ